MLQKILYTLFLIAPLSLSAQNSEYLIQCTSEDCGVVIALSGVKLRAEPSFTGKTIATIPFAQKVTLLEPVHEYEAINWEYTSDSIQGYWMAIEWKGKKGYAFSAFIGTEINRMTEDFYLLLEDAGACWSDAYASLQYNYYGLFLSPDGSRSELKKIKPSFVAYHDEMGGTAIHAVEKETSIFLFATKEPFAEDGPVQMHWMLDGDPDGGGGAILAAYAQDVQSKLDIPHSNWQLIFEPNQLIKTRDDSINLPAYILYLKDTKSGKKQALMQDVPSLTFTSTIFLRWCGDLDRDGVQDFMLWTEGGDYAQVLFLSRNPGKGKLMRFAGAYYGGDCC